MREELFDGRVRLRPYTLDDAAALYEAARESVSEVNPWLPWCHPEFSIEDARSWLAGLPARRESGTAYEFCIEDAATGQYVGGAGINAVVKDDLRANLGYWVRSSRAGQGFATATASMLARWAFEDLALERVEIVVAVGNKRSQRVAEKVGALREGVERNRLRLHGISHDAVMYSLIPSDLGLE